MYFEFEGGEYSVDFCFLKNLLIMNSAILKINELIKDAGYQYYLVMEPLMAKLLDTLSEKDKMQFLKNVEYQYPFVFYTYCYHYIVLTENEVEKLRTERGWKLIPR